MLRKTPASDIYSFGCVCYEVSLISSVMKQPLLMLGAQVLAWKPGFSLGSLHHAITNASSKCRDFKPTSASDALWNVVEKCWDVKPELRPHLGDIVGALSLGLSSERLGSYDTLPSTWDDGIVSVLSSTRSMATWSMETNTQTTGALFIRCSVEKGEYLLCSGSKEHHTTSSFRRTHAWPHLAFRRPGPHHWRRHHRHRHQKGYSPARQTFTGKEKRME